ncbi:NAD(P)-binding protein [Xylaria intraflava]|nr:NAD(P)-binding protein [Xylaria intraflava]
MPSVLYSPLYGAVALVRHTVFSPLLSGPLLLTATYAPDTLRSALGRLALLFPRWYTPSSTFDLATATTALRVIFGLSIVTRLNRALNTIASNSWRLTASKGWDWHNEIAVITGGASGIGKLVAEKLAALGVQVAVLDIQAIPKSMESNPRIHFFQCDVSSSESVAAAADAVRQKLGHASILINNAGVALPSPLLSTSESALRKVFNVNTISHWFTAQQFVPHMIKANKGHVITVASIASFLTLPMAADYSATKASALAFHEALTSDLKHRHGATNVLTSVIHPNFVRTPLIEKFADHLERSGISMLTAEEVAEPIVAQIKNRRGGQLVIPDGVSLLSGVRAWPTWLQELIRDALSRGSAAA